jgi:hypothetical protein
MTTISDAKWPSDVEPETWDQPLSGGDTSVLDNEFVVKANDTADVFARGQARPDHNRRRVECVRRIAALRDLPENWDSYGARPVDYRSIELAQVTVLALLRKSYLHVPVITATPSGTVGLCWERHGRSLDVEAHAEGHLSYVYLDESDESQDEDGTTRDIWRIGSLLELLD